MKRCSAYIDGKRIADGIRKADRFFKRLVGLTGKKELAEGEGLLLCPCVQIHTFSMRFPIDVLFLSETGEILAVEKSMAPGKISRKIKNCVQVLELKDGTVDAESIRVSQTIVFS